MFGAAIWHMSSPKDLTSNELTTFFSEYGECFADLKITVVDRTGHFEDNLGREEKVLSTQLEQVNILRATLGLPVLVIDRTKIYENN